MPTYRLHQSFRYDYSAPLQHLQHRLMVVPPPDHGDQHRLGYRVTVDGARVRTANRRDNFGNHVFHVTAPRVDEAIEFDTWVEVQRDHDCLPPVVGVDALRDPKYAQQSRLTRPNAALVDIARALRAGAAGPRDLAERITTWVNGALHYAHDATDVRTTAAQALEVGAGVCQDYAHVMLSVARACGLPARYVSGHLMGEGGTHAWVEVLVEDPSCPGRVLALAFDPTHDRRAHSGYVTVAVGRDYSDVAPTSGTFVSPATGRLSCRKRLELADDKGQVVVAAH